MNIKIKLHSSEQFTIYLASLGLFSELPLVKQYPSAPSYSCGWPWMPYVDIDPSVNVETIDFSAVLTFLFLKQVYTLFAS